MSTSTVTEGFMVGRLAFANTSLITRWITPSAGRISAIAKGALRPKSPFLGQLDLYYCCELKLRPPRTGELHTLSECRMIKPQLNLRKEYRRLLCVHYFAQLIETIAEPATPLPRDYELLSKAVDYLCEKSPSRALIERFEKRLLQIHGWLDENNQKAGNLLSVFRHHHWKVPAARNELLRQLSVS